MAVPDLSGLAVPAALMPLLRKAILENYFLGTPVVAFAVGRTPCLFVGVGGIGDCLFHMLFLNTAWRGTMGLRLYLLCHDSKYMTIISLAPQPGNSLMRSRHVYLELYNQPRGSVEPGGPV